jgi:hypothetical protein
VGRDLTFIKSGKLAHQKGSSMRFTDEHIPLLGDIKLFKNRSDEFSGMRNATYGDWD